MKRRTSTIAVAATLSMVVALATSNARGQAGGTGTQDRERKEEACADRTRWKIGDEGGAVAEARRILGVADKTPPHLSAALVKPSEDNTPFLSAKVVGRPIWQVVVADWRLELPSASRGPQDGRRLTFDMFIDPETGGLLKLVSRWPEGVPAIAPEPTARVAEEQMRRAGLEEYTGFPQSKPPVDFLRALDVVYKEGVGDPLVAEQIVARCVVRSFMGREPRTVWAITLRGIPPIPAAYPGIPVDARNHIRNIVDAETGEWISAGTCPQPAPDPVTEE
jgi:hypothetical protein